MAERKKLTTRKLVGMGAIALTVMIVLIWVRSQLSGLLGAM